MQVLKKTIRTLQRNVLFWRYGFFPAIRKNPPYEYLGSPYGGWPLIPELVNPNSVVLSFGIGTDISFDLAAIERFGVTVHGFDPTPRCNAWLAKQNVTSKFKFHEIGLADRNGTLTFAAPDNPAHASYSAVKDDDNSGITLKVATLESLMADLNLDHIDVLKMDIEGSEIEVLQALPAGSFRPNQLLVEFHHRIHETSFMVTKDVIQGILDLGYEIFFISYTGDEFAFVRTLALSEGD